MRIFVPEDTSVTGLVLPPGWIPFAADGHMIYAYKE